MLFLFKISLIIQSNYYLTKKKIELLIYNCNYLSIHDFIFKFFLHI